jgi:choline dehydrogenase-like flavoprotein
MMRYTARGDAVKTLQRMAREAKDGHLPDDVASGLWDVVQDLDMFAFNVYRRKVLGRPLLPKPEDLQRISFVTHNEQAPNPDSRVTLVRERDALGVQRVALDWRLTHVDKLTAVRHAEAIGAELARVGAGLFRMDDWLRDGTDEWSPRMVGGYHHIGTTRMAADPKEGVVDANCRVHGIENLYVAGSSVFPTGGNINPTLTLVALALRLADHLRRGVA